jgi:uncharacterized membrane protein SpoIIM required for sporulation
LVFLFLVIVVKMMGDAEAEVVTARPMMGAIGAKGAIGEVEMAAPEASFNFKVRAVAIAVIAIASIPAYYLIINFGALLESAQESAHLNKSAGLNEYTNSGQESTAMVGMWPIFALFLLGVAVCIAGYLVWKPQRARTVFQTIAKFLKR